MSPFNTVKTLQKINVDMHARIWYYSLDAKILTNRDQMTEISLPHNLTLRDYQAPMWNHMMQDKRNLRACCIWPRRNGKDLICLNIMIAKAISRVGNYLYIAPFQTQMRLIVWNGKTADGIAFLDHIPPQLIAKKLDGPMEITLVNGSMIKFIGSDNYDSKMGAGAAGAIFTEFSLQKPEAWNYIRPMLRETGGWALFNFTARGMNHGHKMHKMASLNERWFHQYLTCEDTGFPTQEDIQEEREDGMEEALIQQEYYNDWNASTEGTFLPLKLVSPSFDRMPLAPEDYQNEPKVFACDVAYARGGDKATIAYRQGRKIHWLRWYQGMDNQSFADEIARLAKVIRPHLINIDAGRGEGVISRLERLGFSNSVNPIHFGGTVYEESVKNRKAQMWLRMLEWFGNPAGPDLTGLDEHPQANNPVEEALKAELSTPFMIRDEKHVISVETKSQLRTRGEKSPDLAETIGLAHAEDLQNEEDYDNAPVFPEAYSEQNEYDPMSFMEGLG